MKKILLFSCLVILIPYIIISILFKNDKVEFIFTNNTTVRILRTATNEIDVVPLEEYIMGVVAGEMPISFELEALKAQAVASRSYVMYQMIHNKNDNYDVVDTVLNQVYLDDQSLKDKWGDKYGENIDKVQQAVSDTAYKYLTYDDEIVEAMFFSTSAGYTENSEDVFSASVPYLRSVESSWDNISPVFDVSMDYTYDIFCNLLGIPYSKNLNIEILEQTPHNKIKKIKINDKEFTGTEVTNLLSLKSGYFTIKEQDNKVYISTKGYGHGVGMSQYGAQGMALEGYTYDNILKHYYTGVEIKKIKN